MRVYRRKDRGHKGHVYWIEYRRQGKRFRRSLRVRDLRLAERLARSYLDEIDSRGVPFMRKDVRTVRELLPLYERDLVTLGRDMVYVEKVLRRLERFLPVDRPVAEIKSRELEAILALVPGGDKTRAHVFDSFRSFCNWAVRKELLLRSPMVTLQKGRVKPTWKERRSLAFEEFQRLLNACPFERAVFYLFLALTGLRTVEARRVEWSDVDLVRKVLRVRPHDVARKNLRLSEIPLRADLAAWLLRWRGEERRAGCVFPAIPKRETYYRDLARAGIAKETDQGRLDFHALRVTWSTWIAETGASAQTAQKLMRHETLTMTGHYTRFDTEHLRQAVDGMRGAFAIPERGGEEDAA